jgi:hypothetical protein
MILFALCIQPLKGRLEMCLAGVSTGRIAEKIKGVVYDIRFVTRPEEFGTIPQVIGQYERGSGAYMNPAKSKALAIGNWTLPAQLGIDFHPSLKILDIFAATTEMSGTHSWGTIVHAMDTGKTHILAQITPGTCTIHKYILIGEAGVHGTSLATMSPLCSTTCNGMQLVHMARRLGTSPHCCQM